MNLPTDVKIQKMSVWINRNVSKLNFLNYSKNISFSVDGNVGRVEMFR